MLLTKQEMSLAEKYLSAGSENPYIWFVLINENGQNAGEWLRWANLYLCEKDHAIRGNDLTWKPAAGTYTGYRCYQAWRPGDRGRIRLGEASFPGHAVCDGVCSLVAEGIHIHLTATECQQCRGAKIIGF